MRLFWRVIFSPDDFPSLLDAAGGLDMLSTFVSAEHPLSDRVADVPHQCGEDDDQCRSNGKVDEIAGHRFFLLFPFLL
ncbi:hypothetical protein P9199_00280 [Geobacillus stearothermophilus]|uniref:hypothetical protein n=1 Tax=Geobacillus stearothermophilus TaxID=1422 RepID=UPI002E22FB69|nr:hypothetical protein [Geobacillus stearothermophilus]MED4299523.1 hypothetical protein [Geobacillus stearothermophilus]